MHSATLSSKQSARRHHRLWYGTWCDAAPQVKGAVSVGGRSPSVWDIYQTKPGNIADGATGNVAADFYNRYATMAGG